MTVTSQWPVYLPTNKYRVITLNSITYIYFKNDVSAYNKIFNRVYFRVKSNLGIFKRKGNIEIVMLKL